MARFRKFACYNYKFATRDEREMDIVREFTDDVAVVALKGLNDNAITTNGIPIKRLDIEDQTGNKLVWYAKSFTSMVRGLRQEHADILSCHDLKALIIGYLASIGAKPKPALIYDAHEFEIGRNSDLSKSRVMTSIKTKLERYLMRRCAFSIVVNDSIANEMQRVHCLRQRPIVARSTPYLWQRDEVAISRARAELLDAFESIGGEFILMYHGMLMPGRGIERDIECLVHLPESIKLVVLGDGDELYVSSLVEYAGSLGLSKRVLFHPAVRNEVLEAYVAAADIGLVTVEAISRSYYFMLPNKLFENIQAEVPVIASDFPETGELLRQYGIGLLCDPSNPREIAHCVTRLYDDYELYEQKKKSLQEAKQRFCWQVEKVVLQEAYNDLFSSFLNRKGAEDRADDGKSAPVVGRHG